jgi:hypothetical protein
MGRDNCIGRGDAWDGGLFDGTFYILGGVVDTVSNKLFAFMVWEDGSIRKTVKIGKYSPMNNDAVLLATC